MINILKAKFSERLKNHINDVAFSPLWRVSPERIAEKALPNIGLVELVNGDDFSLLYDDLYISTFPHRVERERSDLITERLGKEFAGERIGLAPYRIVGIRDHQSQAIGAAQFSVLMLPGGQFAVPYLQYIYVRPQNRRQDMAEVLHTMILAVATADATQDRRTVPFTLFETEPPDHGITEKSRATASQRIQIHSKAGAIALVLLRESDGQFVSAHVQPGLEIEDPPLTLTWAVRPSPAYSLTDLNAQIGKDLVAGYYQSLRDEGFPEVNIRLAESIFEGRLKDCTFHLMPLSQIDKLEGVSRPSKPD